MLTILSFLLYKDINKKIIFGTLQIPWRVLLLIRIMACLKTEEVNKHQDLLISCITGFSMKFFGISQNLVFMPPIEIIEMYFRSTVYGKLRTKSISASSPIPKCSKPEKNMTIITLNSTFLTNEELGGLHNTDKTSTRWSTFFNSTSNGEFEDHVLKSLHQENKWSFVVSIGQNNTDKEISFENFHGYILILKVQNNTTNIIDNFMNQIQVLTFNNLLNQWAPVLVVIHGVSEINDIQKSFTKIFHILSSIRVMNSMIAFQNISGVVTIFTGFPYDSASEMCPEMLNITMYATCKSGNRINSEITYLKLPKIRKSERKYKCPIELIMPGELLPLVIHKNKSDKYNITSYNGILIKLLTTVSKHLGRPLNVFFSGKKDVYVRSLCRYQFIQARQEYVYYYTISYSWFVPKAESYSQWVSIFRVFSFSTWISMLFSLFLGTTIFQIIKLTTEGKKWCCRDAGRNVLDNWAILLGISICEPPNNLIIRIFFISWVVYSFALNVVFQTYVTSYFIDPGSKYQIKTFQEILQNNYDLIFDKNINILPFLFVIDIEIKLHVTLNIIDSIVFFLNKTKSAMLISNYIYKSKHFEDCRNELSNILYRFKQDKIEDSQLIGILNPLLVDSVKSAVNHITEAGILEKFAKDMHEYGTIHERKERLWDLKDEYIAISIYHLQSVILLFLFGISVSIVCFSIEIGMKKLRKLRK